MPPDITSDQLIEELSRRFSRVERAILGDDTIGHLGLARRVETLEVLGRDAGAVHQAIVDSAKDGMRRVHERVDKVEKKIDRLLWAFIGAGAVAGGSVAGVARIIGGA